MYGSILTDCLELQVKSEAFMDSRGWESFCAAFCQSTIEEFAATHIDWGPRQLEIFAHAISFKDAAGKLQSNPALKQITVASTYNAELQIKLDMKSSYLELVDGGIGPSEGQYTSNLPLLVIDGCVLTECVCSCAYRPAAAGLAREAAPGGGRPSSRAQYHGLRRAARACEQSREG